MAPELDEIIRAITRRRFHFGNEDELQKGIARALSGADIDFKREVRLSPRSRIDFLIGAIGLEVKVGGSLSATTRQLWRYAEDPKLEAIILVSTRSYHLDLPDILNDKPFRAVWLQPF